MSQGSDTSTGLPHSVRVAEVADVKSAGCLVIQAEGRSVALFSSDGQIYAVDNRCPHMGFPLHRGTVCDRILTCHWHHARFDLATGGTFDQWADDVRVFPVEVRGDEVWVDVAAHGEAHGHHRQRLRDGLERDIPLVIAKAVIALLDNEADPTDAFRIGLDFGTHYRQDGWGQGLTIHTCMMNLVPRLAPSDRPRALYHGLSAVARDSADMPARFGIRPLPTATTDLALLKRWFRQFVEVRDAEGAERCVVSAIRAGADHRQMADMLFAAATDHRYIQTGHVLDFTNKALEALDVAGWTLAEPVLTSLTAGYASAERMEESNAWRHPVDLVEILEGAFEGLPEALGMGRQHQLPAPGSESLLAVLLGDDPQSIAEGLLTAIREGRHVEELAGLVAYAAALRITRFPTSNEFGDWDTALHTFTFANAVHQGLRRVVSPELVRGIFDAAMSVYLDRFLNVPAATVPEGLDATRHPEEILSALSEQLNQQQQVNQAGSLVSCYLSGAGDPTRLQGVLGQLLLREDRDFHTIQAVEGAVRQARILGATPHGAHVMIAASRYLAAHSPTVRAQGQTYQIAERLHRGEALYADEHSAGGPD